MSDTTPAPKSAEQSWTPEQIAKDICLEDHNLSDEDEKILVPLIADALRTAVAEREKHLRVLAEEVEAWRDTASDPAQTRTNLLWAKQATDAARSLDFAKGLSK